MPAKFIQITSEEQLATFFASSHLHPVALLKHSNSCGISSDILHQMGEIDGDVHVIVIQENRGLSNSVAEQTGRRHQSPQAFVVKDGVAIYHATHYGISPRDIQNKLAKN